MADATGPPQPALRCADERRLYALSKILEFDVRRPTAWSPSGVTRQKAVRSGLCCSVEGEYLSARCRRGVSQLKPMVAGGAA